MERIIKGAKNLKGVLNLPGDKSISHRALMTGAISRGVTRIKGLLESDDCNYTAAAFSQMGVSIKKQGNITRVDGHGLKGLSKPAKPIYAGNSGTTMRILPGILSGQDFESTLTGEEGILARPMKRIIKPLSRMGVRISGREGEYPPLVISGGRVRPVTYRLPVPSAQVKSAILYAGLYSRGITTVIEKYKSRDHTERILKFFGASVSVDKDRVSVKGGKELIGRDLDIPADISSAGFFMAAATLLKGSKIKIKNVSINPTRAGIIKVLLKMGADIRIVNKKRLFEPAADLVVKSAGTRGIVIDRDMIPSIIDELPVIFVVAALSKGATVIKGAEELRVKETDRINSMQENLRAMGARFDLKHDDIVISGVDRLRGAGLKSYDDHRTCMSMAIAALTAPDPSRIEGAESVSKSFPGFFDALFSLTRV